MNRNNDPWSVRPVGHEFGWLLLPSLIVALLGMAAYAYVVLFASRCLSALFSSAPGRFGLITAAGVSLLIGMKANRLLLGPRAGKGRRLTSCLVILIVGGIVFLLFLDAVALSRM